jgi:hypothetical protein
MKFITRCLLYSAIGILFTCFFEIVLESVFYEDVENITTESSTEISCGTESTDVSVEYNGGSTVGEPVEDVPEESTQDSEVADTEVTDTEMPDTEIEEVTYYCEWGDFHLTKAEYELILTTVFCESGGESSKEQHAVACAILNQINSGKFGSTFHKVIYKKNNFSVTKWPNFENRGWTDKVEKSVLRALVDNPYPRNMYYFRTKHFHTFKGAIDYKKIGEFYFSTSN